MTSIAEGRDILTLSLCIFRDEQSSKSEHFRVSLAYMKERSLWMMTLQLPYKVLYIYSMFAILTAFRTVRKDRHHQLLLRSLAWRLHHGLTKSPHDTVPELGKSYPRVLHLGGAARILEQLQGRRLGVLLWPGRHPARTLEAAEALHGAP